MLDVEELENQWKQYQRKKKKPFYIGGSILLLLLAFVLSIVNHKIDMSYFNIKKISNKLFSKDIEKNSTNTQVEAKQIVKHKKAYLLNNAFKDALLSQKKLKPKPQKQSKEISTPLDEDELYVEKEISKPVMHKKTKLVGLIKVSSDNSAYKDVERRFKRSHNINDSMFLANMYYKKRQYKKSLYWSMQTNKLNKNIEESWLIFAKSKLRLGRKNEAIRVLKTYIKRSNSYEAKKLLKKISK